MKLILLLGFLTTCGSTLLGEKLFDGRSFTGWEGDTNKIWRIEDGAIVAGSMSEKMPQNEFLCTTRQFTNFVLRLKFKLVGRSDSANAGVQIRSQRIASPPNEVSGYQADMGPGWWGALYDEARRNKVLIRPEEDAVKKALKPDGWNDYKIMANEKRIQTWINDVPMIDYTETDQSIPQHGVIALQIHSGGPAKVYYKDIVLDEKL